MSFEMTKVWRNRMFGRNSFKSSLLEETDPFFLYNEKTLYTYSKVNGMKKSPMKF